MDDWGSIPDKGKTFASLSHKERLQNQQVLLTRCLVLFHLG
jgi:hypothetical protein